MQLKLFILLFSLSLSGITITRAAVDTVTTHSAAMNKNIRALILRPDSYNGSVQFPVVYLLHGHGGTYTNWIDEVPEIQNFADKYQMLIVCPDGGTESWYLDSPQKPDSKYETYIANELVGYVDSNYKTISQRKGRAITGLSMGGHGALYLAIKNQTVFGAAGSMSGGLDLRPFPKNWGISGHLGDLAANLDNWNQNSVINLVALLKPNSLSLIIDCGINDFFFDVNQAFHQKLIQQQNST